MASGPAYCGRRLVPRRKSQAVSRDTQETRAKGKAHGDKVKFRAMDIVMTILHAFNCPQCPYEIFCLAIYMGLIKDDMDRNTINVACTTLSKRGHIISTRERGTGAGGLPSVRYILSWVQRDQGPHDYSGHRNGVRQTIRFPTTMKSKVKAAYKNPSLWTPELRDHAWAHAFERFMAEEMDREAA